MKLPLELIEWIDSSGRAGWDSKTVYEQWAAECSLACESVGFVIHETAERVVIVQNTASNSYDHAMIIPKIAIVSRRKL